MSNANYSQSIDWNYLWFTEGGLARKCEIREFLASDKVAGHPAAEEIRREFAERMDYLNWYGRNRETGEGRFNVVLGSDWAPYSLTITWWNAAFDRPVFSGAMIWHGGSNETFAVSLTPCWFDIHT